MFIIYAIRNTKNGKIYIGQTTQDPSLRWTDHKKHLRANKSVNTHLQSAWNRYGEAAFTFELMAVAETQDELDTLEQHYIEKVKAHNNQYGYNKRQGGSGKGKVHADTVAKMRQNYLDGKVKVTWAKAYAGLIAPDGTVHSDIHDLKKFALAHGFTSNQYRKLCDIANGKIPVYKGWRHINYGKPGFGVPRYVGKRPGERLDMDEASYKEWRTNIKRETGKKNSQNWVKSYPTLIAPDGTIHSSGENLAEFCRKHELNRRGMSKMVSGDRKSYKGWKRVS